GLAAEIDRATHIQPARAAAATDRLRQHRDAVITERSDVVVIVCHADLACYGAAIAAATAETAHAKRCGATVFLGEVHRAGDIDAAIAAATTKALGDNGRAAIPPGKHATTDIR